MTTFRVMTYNVHSCVGTDGRLEPGRIAEVIARSNADVVALQELDVCQKRTQGLHQPQWLAETLQMFVHFTAARRCEDGHYGNAILSRHPLSVRSEGNLPRKSGEQRAVQWIELSIGNQKLNVMNTHLSIHFRERLLQIEQLLGAEWIAKSEVHLPLVVCGDLNSRVMGLRDGFDACVHEAVTNSVAAVGNSNLSNFHAGKGKGAVLASN